MLSNRTAHFARPVSKSKPRTILIVGHNKEGAIQLQRALDSLAELEFETAYIPDSAHAIQALEKRRVDALFVIDTESESTGTELIQRIRGAGHIVPVIAIVDQFTGDYCAIDAIGADDCIVRSNLNRAVLSRSFRCAEARSRERRAKRELLQQADQLRELAEAQLHHTVANRHDVLTKVLTRIAWQEAIQLENSRSVRHGHQYSVIVLDVDGLGEINDHVGHRAGDACLVQVAETLHDAIRDIDVIGRYDGGQFIILCAETPLSGALILAERLRQGVHDLSIPRPTNTTDARVTVSAGVSDGPQDGWEPVVRQAIKALQSAKQDGGNCIRPESASR